MNALLPTCGHDGCTAQAPFDTPDGPRCFTHDPVNAVFMAAKIEHDNEQAMAEAAPKIAKRKPRKAPDDGLNDTAARALCSLVLQATADALSADAAKMEAAILQLAADLPAMLEVAAGVLFATTAIAGAAGLTDEEVFTMAAAFEDAALQESEGGEPS
jgi:hypothetical protein